MGPKPGDHGVMFPGNKGNITYSSPISRTPPPPLPGGYVVGEEVYFTGTSETVAPATRSPTGRPAR